MTTQPRILVVDDVADNREIVRARLESQGYAVETADDGEAALAAVAVQPPDLILLDVMMPKLDGIETVRRLKADAGLPFIPVILLTAKTDSKDVIAGLEAGADEYLTTVPCWLGSRRCCASRRCRIRSAVRRRR